MKRILIVDGECDWLKDKDKHGECEKHSYAFDCKYFIIWNGGSLHRKRDHYYSCRLSSHAFQANVKIIFEFITSGHLSLSPLIQRAIIQLYVWVCWCVCVCLRAFACVHTSYACVSVFNFVKVTITLWPIAKAAQCQLSMVQCFECIFGSHQSSNWQHFLIKKWVWYNAWNWNDSIVLYQLMYGRSKIVCIQKWCYTINHFIETVDFYQFDRIFCSFSFYTLSLTHKRARALPLVFPSCVTTLMKNLCFVGHLGHHNNDWPGFAFNA